MKMRLFVAVAGVFLAAMASSGVGIATAENLATAENPATAEIPAPPPDVIAAQPSVHGFVKHTTAAFLAGLGVQLEGVSADDPVVVTTTVAPFTPGPSPTTFSWNSVFTAKDGTVAGSFSLPGDVPAQLLTE